MAESDEQNAGADPHSPTGDGPNDPFSPENAPMLNFIMQARIYDVLMGLLTATNKELAKDLLELHLNGNIMGPQPSFNGVFITDLANQEESTAE